MKLEKNKLFNPITENEIRLIGGKTNGIINLNKNKYSFSDKLLQTMLGNMWIPQEISLLDDAKSFKELTKKEQESFEKIISFLVYLDSMVSSALGHIGSYITCSEIQALISIHCMQEVLHSTSYAYILESVVTPQRRAKIYDLACTDVQMKKRNEYIATFHQKFIDNPTDENFLKVVVAQIALEGIYFFSGFLFFYNLAKFGKLTGVSQEISYINRDENTHLSLFINIFKILQKENPELFTEKAYEEINEIFDTATKEEIEWFSYVCGDNIEGLSIKTIEAYMKNLANDKMKSLGLKPIYPNFTTNPFPFVAKMSNPNSVKVDFFETRPINYVKAGKELNLDGIDDLIL